MKNTLRFIASATRARVAFIDMDGCLVERFPVPPHLRFAGRVEALEWWRENLQPTRRIASRIALLYLLRALGVRLVLWTNRSPWHVVVTVKALGDHCWLFSDMLFRGGSKREDTLSGPVMDEAIENNC